MKNNRNTYLCLQLEIITSKEPHPVSPYGPDVLPYMLVVDALKTSYPQAISVPGIVATRNFISGS